MLDIKTFKIALEQLEQWDCYNELLSSRVAALTPGDVTVSLTGADGPHEGTCSREGPACCALCAAVPARSRDVGGGRGIPV